VVLPVPSQRRLAIEEPAIARIRAIMLDHIEGVEDCGIRSLSAAQFLEYQFAGDVPVWSQLDRRIVIFEDAWPTTPCRVLGHIR
jgi:hypothetical protein